jgi:cysteinyl-tRNA synthetase
VTLRPAVKQRCTEFIDTFTAELDNDLNISGATGSLFEFIHDINTLADSEGLNRAEGTLIRETLLRVDTVLGFIFWPEAARMLTLPALTRWSKSAPGQSRARLCPRRRHSR